MNFPSPSYFRTPQYNTIDKLKTSPRSITSQCERFFHDQSLCFNSFHNSRYIYMCIYIHTHGAYTFPSFQWIHEWSWTEKPVTNDQKWNTTRNICILHINRMRRGGKTITDYVISFFFPVVKHTHKSIPLFFFPCWGITSASGET